MRKTRHILPNIFFFFIILLIPHAFSLTSKNQFSLKNAPILLSLQTHTQKELDLHCDIEIEGPICINSGERVLLPPSSPENIVFQLSFDQKIPQDTSVNQFHPKGTVLAGPSFMGNSHSGLFKDGNFLTINHDDMLNIDIFSVTFWIFVYEHFESDHETKYCPIIEKGDNEKAPSIQYDKDNNNLRILISTSEKKEGEEIISFSKILPQKWYHIAVKKNANNEVKLYVNGILDKNYTLKGQVLTNESPFYIGNTPSTKDSCKFPFLLDHIRFWNQNLEEDFIQAEASPALGGLAPNMIKFACNDCTINEVICEEGYSVCTSIELHTGGYQVARNLGWLDWNTYIWTKSAFEKQEDFQDIKGLGLCCKNLQ